MSDLGKETVLQPKCARIISVIADKAGISLEDAMRVFYNSEMFQLLQDGTAELHCRSDSYLANEILNNR